MNSKDLYLKTAKSYTDGVRELFAPSGPTTKERGVVRGPSSFGDLAKKAEQLSSVSDDFTKAIVYQLKDADPDVSMEGSTRMLAKALTDLEISEQLLQAAEDEINKTSFDKSRGADRGKRSLAVSEEYLTVLTGDKKTIRKGVERGGGPSNIEQARIVLSESITDSLTLISDRVTKTTQSSLGGIVGLEAGELAKAAGTLGMNIAEMIGQGEKISHLYELFRSFLGKVYDALVSLIGKPLIQKAGQKVVEWVHDLKEGKYLKEILEALYQTNPTKVKLNEIVGNSQANLDNFKSAIESVNGLSDGFGNQIKLAEKLLNGLKFIGGLSDNILPQGKLIFAAGYIALGGYAVLTGADYVDSPRIKWLDRVPGVSRILEKNLKG